MQYVAQLDHNGCAVAVVAMAIGRSYEYVKGLLPESRRTSLCLEGLTYYFVYEALVRHGFAVQPLWRYDQLGEGARLPERAPWPPKPWAPCHVVQVPGHWIAMDAAGRVLDPARSGARRLVDYKPELVVGVWPVGRAVR